MSPSERLMMAGVGVVCAVLLINGLRAGQMTGEYHDHDINDQPIQFALSTMGYGVALVFCVLFAAGYQTHDMWSWVTRLVAKP
ncbi:hypothetical protein [uncultured Enterovirga sp.]|uniref:hypothetical protein n=1 Tax=uncultured Enterovirga sp. TaxID=2026352 RepID=UPI0035C9F5C6